MTSVLLGSLLSRVWVDSLEEDIREIESHFFQHLPSLYCARKSKYNLAIWAKNGVSVMPL